MSGLDGWIPSEPTPSDRPLFGVDRRIPVKRRSWMGTQTYERLDWLGQMGTMPLRLADRVRWRLGYILYRVVYWLLRGHA